MKMRAIPSVVGFVAYLLLHGATQTLGEDEDVTMAGVIDDTPVYKQICWLPFGHGEMRCECPADMELFQGRIPQNTTTDQQSSEKKKSLCQYPCINSTDIDECIDNTTCQGKNEMCVNYNCGFKCVARECPSGYFETHRTMNTFLCECDEHQNCSVDAIWFGVTDLRPRKMREGFTQLLFIIHIQEGAEFNYTVDTSQSTHDDGVTLATNDTIHVIAGTQSGNWVLEGMVNNQAILEGYQDFTVSVRLSTTDYQNNKTDTIEVHIVTIVSKR